MGGENCGACGCGERTALHDELLRERACAEDLHDRRATLLPAHETPQEERGRRDRLADGIRRFERDEIHCRDCDAVCSNGAGTILTVTAPLRELLDEVANFRTNLVSGARGLPLAATAGGLTAFAAAADWRVLFIFGARRK